MPASIHEHPEEWLAAALADGLSPEERRALDEHLAGCEHCRELQADFAALDETLLRDFPLAVGPDGGFETRLVAGFRRRQGRGGRLEKLRALAAWLLRQRGVRFAGVAAVLLGLVGLGQFLTGDRSSFPQLVQSGTATKDQVIVALPATKIDVSHLTAAGSGDVVISNPSEVLSANDKLHPLTTNRFVGGVPVGDIDVGRDVTAGFAEVQIPIIGPDMHIPGTYSFDLNQEGRSSGKSDFTLRGGLAYTGTTDITAGRTSNSSGTVSAGPASGTSTVNVGGTLPDLVLLDGRRLRDGNRKDGDGFVNATPMQNAAGVIPNASGTPAPTSATQNFNFSGAPVEQPQDRVVIKGTNVPSSEEVGAAPQNAPTATPAPPDVRKLIRNARAEIEVVGFDAAVDAVTAAATRDGGFLDTRNSARGGNGKIQGTLVVKVLPENLDRFLASLRALGDVKNQTIQTEDVTKDYFDTDARLRNSRRMEERLLKMLDEVKGKMSEVLQVEKELARVRAEIETMQGQLKMYDGLMRYATVTLDVRERDLNQPAAFLLRETATLSLLAADVEKTAAEVRRIADAAHAQTARSELTRDPAGKSRATLRLLIAPEGSADVIAQIKALGRVENFHVQDERIAQNGTSADAVAQDPAKVEHAPVALDLTISHDEQISRQVTLTLVAGDVEGAFEKARGAAVAAGAEIVESNVTRPSAGHADAVLGVRVPAAGAGTLLASFQSLGRAGEAETRRVGSGPEADAGPVLIRLSVVDAEPAVQQTTLRVQTADVERRAADIKREAANSHAVVEESNFASEGDGRQRAGLRFRLPMSAYAEFVERVRALGTVKDFTVQRSDRPARPGGDAVEAHAPVVVDLLLYSEGRIVGEESGLSSTLRRTFGQGAGALMWSVRMIGVALAFLAPWVVLAAAGIGVVVWWRARNKRTTSKS